MSSSSTNTGSSLSDMAMSVHEQPGVMAVVDDVTKVSLMSRTERVLRGVLFQKSIA